MQYLILIGTGILLVGSLVKNHKSFADNLKMDFTVESLPEVFQGDLQLPVKVRIDNPVAQAFKVPKLFITIYKKTSQGEPYLASTSALRY